MAKKKNEPKAYSTLHLLGTLLKEGVKSATKTGLVGQAAKTLSPAEHRRRMYNQGDK